MSELHGPSLSYTRNRTVECNLHRGTISEKAGNTMSVSTHDFRSNRRTMAAYACQTGTEKYLMYRVALQLRLENGRRLAVRMFEDNCFTRNFYGFTWNE